MNTTLSSEYQLEIVNTTTALAPLIAFIMQSRKQLFPMLNHDTLPKDLQQFHHYFIEDELGCFLTLYWQQQLIGSVGFCRYNHRFHQFDLSAHRTVEIVKLFIDPNFRRLGLAHYLVYQLKQIAQQRQITHLYLHTHPFLQGAKNFWLKQGFDILHQEQDGVWDTIHMIYKLV